MRIINRCLDMLKLLEQEPWLKSKQIRRKKNLIREHQDLSNHKVWSIEPMSPTANRLRD